MIDLLADVPVVAKEAEGADRLKALAGVINTAHDRVLWAGRTSVASARAAGELLLEAKKLVGHGGWLNWLAANVHVDASTAQRYMRLSERWEEITAKYGTVPDLTMRGALRVLSGAEDEDGGGPADASLEALASLTPEEQLAIVQAEERETAAAATGDKEPETWAELLTRMARSHVRLRNLSVKVSEQETQHYRELLAEMDRELERLRGLEATSTPPAEEATSPGAGSK